MTGNTPLKLISMSEINAEEVQWLWYPYIPLGKLTILQGDPGEGKTSFILAVIAALTRGDPLPECEQAAEPCSFGSWKTIGFFTVLTVRAFWITIRWSL